MNVVLKGSLVAGGVLLILAGLSFVIVGPRAVHEGGRIVVPVIGLMGEGQRFGRFIEENAWRPPAVDVITVEQLDRFLAVRARIDALCARYSLRMAVVPDRPPMSFDEAAGVVGVLRGLVPEQMAAYRERAMTPAEYDYVDRLVYGRWREGLLAGGCHPRALELAAAELVSAAAEEPDAAAATRIRGIARDLRARPVPPPDGVPAEIHELLLAHGEEIDRLSLDAYRNLPKLQL